MPRRIKIAVVFEPRASDEQQHERNHETLLGGSQNKETEKAFHEPA